MTEPTFLGSNLNLVKEHNHRAVLLSLLYNGSLSRIELAGQTSLSATTITNLVDELLAEGVVEECSSDNQDARRVGRPRSSLCLVENARYALGVHMRVGVYRVVLVNLLGKPVAYQEVEFTNSMPARKVIEDIAETAQDVVINAGVERGRILGLGIGASGLVNYRTGYNVLAANFGWRDVPMRDWLVELLRIPVVVDNNVRCMALGESLFGAGRGVNSLAFVYGRFGVGAGIVVDGKVLRGSGLGAGEIGHSILLPDNGPLCRCGKRGCLEPLVSEPALVRQAEMAADMHPDSILAACLRGETALRPVKRLFLALRRGDPWAKELVETSAHYLGLALSNLVNLINPELILLGGLFDEQKDIYLPLVQETMVANSFGGLGEKVRLQATSFGWQAGMIGASALALAKYLYLKPEEV